MRASGGPAPRRSARGVALPVALILMTLISLLVVAQVRRGQTEERLAGNSRQSVALANAANVLLRYCEYRMIALPLDTVTVAANPERPAWSDPANWTPATTFTFPEFNVPGVVYNACLIEDATAELAAPTTPRGGLENDAEHGYHKYRITAQVRAADPSMPGVVRPYFLQSEIRVFF